MSENTTIPKFMTGHSSAPIGNEYYSGKGVK